MSRSKVEWRFQDAPTTPITASAHDAPTLSNMSSLFGSVSHYTTHLQRRSGIFASDLKDGASQVLNTARIRAADKYTPFFALITLLSFVPGLLFVVFVIGVVVFVMFTSTSFAITATTLTFTLAATLLASIILYLLRASQNWLNGVRSQLL